MFLLRSRNHHWWTRPQCNYPQLRIGLCNWTRHWLDWLPPNHPQNGLGPVTAVYASGLSQLLQWSCQQTSSTIYSASYEKTSQLSNHVLKPIHCCQGLRSVTSITGLLLTSNVVATRISASYPRCLKRIPESEIAFALWWSTYPMNRSTCSRLRLQWLKQRHQFCPPSLAWTKSHSRFRIYQPTRLYRGLKPTRFSVPFVNILQQLSVTEFHLKSIFAFLLSVLNTCQNIKTLSLSNCGEFNRFDLPPTTSNHSRFGHPTVRTFLAGQPTVFGRLTSLKLRPRDIESDDLPKLLEVCATSLTSLELDLHYLGGWYSLIFPDLTQVLQAKVNTFKSVCNISLTYFF